MQILSIVIALIGTYMLAFGLRVKEGISKDLRKEFNLDKSGLIAPSDVHQRPFLFYGGLGLLTIAALIQTLLLFI